MASVAAPLADRHPPTAAQHTPFPSTCATISLLKLSLTMHGLKTNNMAVLGLHDPAVKAQVGTCVPFNKGVGGLDDAL